MKAVLISIQPKWCEKIASGKKTIEVRKTRPKIEPPFPCYIYCTRQKVNGEILLTHNKKVEGRNRGFREQGDIPLAGKVIGEFVCDKIHNIKLEVDFETGASSWECGYNAEEDCLSMEEFDAYLKEGFGYGWHISDLVIYDKPKALGEFQQCHKCPHTCVSQSKSLCEYHRLKRPPQSWCYVEVQE